MYNVLIIIAIALLTFIIGYYFVNRYIESDKVKSHDNIKESIKEPIKEPMEKSDKDSDPTLRDDILYKSDMNKNVPDKFNNYGPVFGLTFSLNLLKYFDLRKNLIFSPFNLLQAFSILQDASEGITSTVRSANSGLHSQSGITKSELDNFLTIPNSYSPIHNISYQLKNKCSYSNYVVLRDDCKLNLDFVNSHNLINYATFNKNNLSKIVKKINKQVSTDTHNKINGIVDEKNVDSSTSLFIVSTLYFKGKWRDSFDKKLNYFGVFNGSIPNIEYMIKKKISALYTQTNDLQLIELDYENPVDINLGILLPNPNFFQVDILKQLGQLTKNLTHTKINELIIPKFKIESTFGKEIINSMRNANVNQLFTDADISKLALPNSDNVFQLSSVVHRALIEVDNEGTVAAAATAIMTKQCNGIIKPDKNEINFIADHNFYFYLRHTKSDAILFIGQFLGK